MPAQTFLDFEHDGWENPAVCEAYDGSLATVTTQCIDALLDAAGVKAGVRLLGVATGAGYVAAAAAQRGAPSTGVDFSASQVAMARTRYPALSFEQAGADALPFAAGSFDAVVSNFGMPHFPDPGAAMREALRVLAPEGRFAFSVWDVPERAVPFGAVYAAVKAHGSMDVGLPAGPNFFLFSDPDKCRAALLDAGFVSPSVVTVPQLWRVADPGVVVQAILQATVRASATLRAQTPKAREAILTTIKETIASYKKGERCEVPAPAVVASAMKPKS